MMRQEPISAHARRLRGVLLIATAALVLAACGEKSGGGEKPTGQVVARLNGEDITILEVNAELAGTPIPPSVTRRDAERIALQNIVTRRMLKASAKERKLDQSPQFILQQRRTDEQLFVQALARDVASKVQPPASDEIDNFIKANPQLFSERKFFILDQIQFLRPANIEKLGFAGAKTMAEVEAILTANKIEFRRQPASLDALGANPDFIREVTKVLDRNPQELFMFANQVPNAPAPVVLVNQVKETRSMPFTGERSREYAKNFLQNQRIQTALRAEVEKQQKAAKDKVVFQEGWEPKEPPTPDAAALAGTAPTGPGVAPAAPSPVETTAGPLGEAAGAAAAAGVPPSAAQPEPVGN